MLYGCFLSQIFNRILWIQRCPLIKFSETVIVNWPDLSYAGGDIGATVRNLTGASYDQKRMAENLAEVVDFLHVTKDKHQKEQQTIPDANKDGHRPHCEYPWELMSVHVLECAVHIARENVQKTRVTILLSFNVHPSMTHYRHIQCYVVLMSTLIRTISLQKVKLGSFHISFSIKFLTRLNLYRRLL